MPSGTIVVGNLTNKIPLVLFYGLRGNNPRFLYGKPLGFLPNLLIPTIVQPEKKKKTTQQHSFLLVFLLGVVPNKSPSGLLHLWKTSETSALPSKPLGWHPCSLPLWRNLPLRNNVISGVSLASTLFLSWVHETSKNQAVGLLLFFG